MSVADAFVLTTEEAKSVLPSGDEFRVQADQSLTAYTVAEIFAALEQRTVGIKPDDQRLLKDLPEIAQTRIRGIAERAIKWLDPDFRVRVADETVTRYLAEHFEGIVPTESEERIEMERARRILALFAEAEATEL